MSRTEKYARQLSARLRDPVTLFRRPYHEIRGGLDVGPVIAPLTIYVPWWFRDLKRRPPLVACHADWMKREADWHNRTYMCWVIPDEWKDHMNWRGKPVGTVLSEGVNWLLADVTSLINRHYLAHLEGHSEWRTEWKAWGHDETGVAEYQREKRLRQAICRASTTGLLGRLSERAHATT